MRINIKLIALFVVVYLVALVATTPLSWVKQYIDPLLQAQGVRLLELQGNLWRGSGQFQVSQQPTYQVTWQSQPAELFLARLPYQLSVTTPNVDVSGQVRLTPFGLALEGFSGYVDEGQYQRVLANFNADIQGRLAFNGVSADSGWGFELGEASGDLSWSGGPLNLRFGSNNQRFEVPQMAGVIVSDDQAWRLNITGLNGESLIESRLERSGDGVVQVRRVLADQMNLSIPGSSPILVELAQKVF
ncbi:MAG: type II secretion system protein N [Saccharospirillum sp.]